MIRIINTILKRFDRLIFLIFDNIFTIIGKQYNENIHRGVIRFIKFGCVGLSNTAVSYLLYLLFLWLFKENGLFNEKTYLVAQWVSYSLSIIWSYFLNNYFVFNEYNSERVWWKTLLKTFAAYSITGIFLNSCLLLLWVEVLHISDTFAPVINLIINVPINYFLNKLWAYKV